MRVLALFFVGILPSVAQADFIQNSEIISGNWTGGAYSFDNTGEFSHCVVSTGYRNGHDLLFSVNFNGAVNVGVSNPDWELNIGDEFPVNVVVDGRRSFQGIATANSEQLAILTIYDLEGALSAFKRGYTLTVKIPSYNIDFDLSGTFRALDQVMNCALTYYKPENSNRNLESNSTDFDKTLLFQIATSMINEAKATDFRYLSESELSENGFSNAVMWESKILGLTSGVFISPVKKDINLRALSAEAAQSLMAECEGDAATSSFDASTPDLPAREVRVMCRLDGEGSDTFFRQILVGDILLETVTIFDGNAVDPEQKKSRESLNNSISIEAAAYLVETDK